MEYKIRTQVFAALSANILTISCGFIIAWPSPSLPKLQDEDSDLPVTSDQGAWITSLMPFGGIFGALLAANIVNRCGRKLSLLLFAISHLLCFVLTAAAQNYIWLYVARFVGGLGVGAAVVITPVYVCEIADDNIRGALGSILFNMAVLGNLVTYCIGPWVNRVTLAAVGSIFPILFVLTFALAHETPYYHIMKKRKDQAEKSLVWLRRRSDVKEELAEITRNVALEQMNRGTLRELVTVPGNRKVVMITLGLVSTQHLSGIMPILSYSSLIFRSSGSTFSSSVSVIITSVVQLLSGTLGLSLTDKVGRRPLLMFSICFTTLSLIGEAVFFQLKALDVEVKTILWLPVTAILGFMSSHSIGLGILPLATAAEISPCNVKSLITTMGSVWSAAISTVLLKVYQVVADSYGIHVGFWIFAASTVVLAVFIYFFVPETKGRSLRDIQDEIQNRTGSEDVLDKLAS